MCPRLKIRELYFEPNPSTIGHWREKYGFYERGIDRRLVFVAESPSDSRDRSDAADFDVLGRRGWSCWDYTKKDDKFRRAREQHGFQHCLITNAVKCGVPRPSTHANLTEAGASCARTFQQPRLVDGHMSKISNWLYGGIPPSGVQGGPIAAPVDDLWGKFMPFSHHRVSAGTSHALPSWAALRGLSPKPG